MRYETQGTDWDPNDRAKVAVHEAGHASSRGYSACPSSESISTWQRKAGVDAATAHCLAQEIASR
jgi:hypothetical protein